MIMTAPGMADQTAAVLDALAAHICVTDRHGRIIAVNRAWQVFAAENNGVPSILGTGVNYLEVCLRSVGPGAREAQHFAIGLNAVLEGRTELFELEYPCHAPDERRWFLARITPLALPQGGAVISHIDISDRRRMELELSRLATTDYLTGLSNRRHFRRIGRREAERFRRLGTPVSVLMIDVDNFKDANDTYGHAAGDAALRILARTCKATLRRIDVVARVGGEEFAALLPDTDIQGACKVAEKLRRAVAEAEVHSGDMNFGITASFGIAELLPGEKGIDKALERADVALYDAKREGRDCVRVYASLAA